MHGMGLAGLGRLRCGLLRTLDKSILHNPWQWIFHGVELQHPVSVTP
jgi:hypothetical protein